MASIEIRPGRGNGIDLLFPGFVTLHQRNGTQIMRIWPETRNRLKYSQPMAKQIITTEKKPIKLWLDDIEDGALEQARNIANLPFTFKHVAIMPDCHQGYGMPIGGVLATKEVVVPNAVGVDIGCGMCAVRTSLRNIGKEDLQKVRERTLGLIPVGHKHQSKKQDASLMPKDWQNLRIVSQEFEHALYQAGTLGGGNHFIEIQQGSDGFVWIMVHSGSRNIGLQVARYYNAMAVELNKRWFSQVTKEKQLAFLPVGTEEAKEYLSEMQFCVDFAFANRKLMMERIKEVLAGHFSNIEFDSFTNIAHNYANWEHHYKTNVIVHRKGATSARAGEIGIIPGSQGTRSYIVEGLGNPESFHSCSHGAGRVMGRKQAQRELNLEAELVRMKEMGVVHGIKSQKDLDEAAGAYKDIDQVMENQKDLVKVLVELKPLAVIKG